MIHSNNKGLFTPREEEPPLDMYFQFVLSFGLFAVLLELPGFLFFQLLNVNRISSLLYAPAFSIALYNVLGIVFGFIGIRSSLWSVFIIPTVLLLVAVLAKAKMAVISFLMIRDIDCALFSKYQSYSKESPPDYSLRRIYNWKSLPSTHSINAISMNLGSKGIQFER